jgi:dihydrofolate synthase/folylpolyglutamate synthase
VLSTFLAAKPLYYDKIDYERMPRIYASIKEQLKIPKIIHLVGTNAKGTTGRFLATALHSLGYSVGHYTSPHILSFNERIWSNGHLASEEALERAHKELLGFLNAEDAAALSYFEYTTLLAIHLYANCEYLVLEAGLGGEHDATSVFENILTIVTPIARDHEAFLGNTIESIASTKLKAIQKRVLFAKQEHAIVYSIADTLLEHNNFECHRYNELLKESDLKNIELLQEHLKLPHYLKENLSVAIAALNLLQIPYSATDFNESRLYGRLTRIAPNVIIDVGHNELAAHAIVNALEGEKFTLVYNSYSDKNYKEILQILKDIIVEVALIPVADSRVESPTIMRETLDALALPYGEFKSLEAEKNYLVFGSFSVVEAFLGKM